VGEVIGFGLARQYPALSEREVERLKLYKVRYRLEAHGFSTAEAHRLLFLRWMVREGLVAP
jgi:hypothetical protein